MRRPPLRCLIITAVAFGIACAPHASADPRDWVPWCSGDQTPAYSNCRAALENVFSGNAPGANPGVPLGVNPGLAPMTGSG